MKYRIADEVFERIEEESLNQAKNAVSKGMYEEAEAIGVLTLIKNGLMTQLNLMGLEIWKKLRTPKSIDELTDMVSKDYGISAEECCKDIEEFVSDLVEKGFLKHE